MFIKNRHHNVMVTNNKVRHILQELDEANAASSAADALLG